MLSQWEALEHQAYAGTVVLRADSCWPLCETEVERRWSQRLKTRSQ